MQHLSINVGGEEPQWLPVWVAFETLLLREADWRKRAADAKTWIGRDGRSPEIAPEFAATVDCQANGRAERIIDRDAHSDARSVISHPAFENPLTGFGF